MKTEKTKQKNHPKDTESTDLNGQRVDERELKVLTCPRVSPEDVPKPQTFPFPLIIDGMFLAGIITPAGIFQNPKRQYLFFLTLLKVSFDLS